MEEEVTIAQAITKLQRELKDDPGYYYGWQANIAMAFKDECHKHTSLGHNLTSSRIHDIANQAAKNFLDILMINIEKDEKV